MNDMRPIPSENYAIGRQSHHIGWIVLHTMAGTVGGADARFHNASAQVSAHYGVGVDGALYTWVSENDTAYHAGDFNVNLQSIGIEHEDLGAYNDPRPDALYTASAALVADICQRYGIPIEAGVYPTKPGIIAHRDVHATACPDALDVQRVIKEAQEVHMTPAQMQELKDFITAQTNVQVQAAIAIALRQMRGANPGSPGNDAALTPHEKIFQTEAR